MKRYQYFGFHGYYPFGGREDIKAEGETLSELKEAIQINATQNKWEYHEILDMQERRWLSYDEVQKIRRSLI